MPGSRSSEPSGPWPLEETTSAVALLAGEFEDLEGEAGRQQTVQRGGVGMTRSPGSCRGGTGSCSRCTCRACAVACTLPSAPTNARQVRSKVPSSALHRLDVGMCEVHRLPHVAAAHHHPEDAQVVEQ